MDTDVPRMSTVKNLHAILDKIQKAAVPDAFGITFLKDMGFTSSNDRAVIKLLKFLGMLDASGRPQASYREFMDHTKSKRVLAGALRHSYDDLFKSDKSAQTRSFNDLKGWFKTKTGAGEKVAEKMATTFKSLASYADFDAPIEPPQPQSKPKDFESEVPGAAMSASQTIPAAINSGISNGIGLTYRIEVHLPDTTNMDTFRAIFRAIREELMQ
jgi:hypothetical protein